jgi:inward rectifier potassium channel
MNLTVKKKQPSPISVRAGQVEFLKINSISWEWRDIYHWIVSLRWPQFALVATGVFFALNLIFATAYRFGGPCIGEMPPDSFSEAFFFSVETLATVGYGHMYPVSTYGHIVVTLELMTGMLWTAVTTGLIFVRFSRPTARVLFSDRLVISPFEGEPTLMLRVANLRHHTMAEAVFRIMYHREEMSREGESVRRYYELKLTFDRLIIFPAAMILRHVIDETSPMRGMTLEDLIATESRFIASVSCVDTVIQAPVQSLQTYLASEIRFGERFVEVYQDAPDGRLIVDYGRLNETEKA